MSTPLKRVTSLNSTAAQPTHSKSRGSCRFVYSCLDFTRTTDQSNGVKKDSATNRAREFSCIRQSRASKSARGCTKSFISEISLSTSSMNWMMKSTSLCLSISSVWKLVIKKEMS